MIICLKKKLYLLFLSWAFAFMANAQEKTAFTLDCNIPGTNGMRIELQKVKSKDKSVISSTVADGKCTLKGEVYGPTLFNLRITNKDLLSQTCPAPADERVVNVTFPLFVEGGTMTYRAAHLDSLITPVFGFYDVHPEKATVTGSKAHEIYMSFLQSISPFEKEKSDIMIQMLSGMKGGNDNSSDVESRLAVLAGKVDSMRLDFIKHHNYKGVTLAVMSDMDFSPFKYTATELDALIEVANRLNDPAENKASILQYLETYRYCLKDMPYCDLQATDAAGKEVRLSDYIVKGKYNLVDFWASWCGPCRRAIPHVKQLHELYGKDALNIISFSTDDDAEKWKQAMEKEQMPWTQLIGRGEYLNLMAKYYRLQGIPLLVIIDPQGHVVCATNMPVVIDKQLIQLIGNRFEK